MTVTKLLASAAAFALFSTPAYADVLVIDSGWQDDVLDVAGQPTLSSPWTFTLTGNGIFSVVDCCNIGDVYTLSGSVAGVTTFFAGSATDVQAEGAYGSFWTDAAYSKIAVLLGAGDYSISITGDGVGGLPAGLGVRLDSAVVPEPAVWALMIGGVGMIGGALRVRNRKVRFATA